MLNLVVHKVTTMKTYGGSVDTTSRIRELRHQMEVNGQLHGPPTALPRKCCPRWYPLRRRRLKGPLSVLDAVDGKILTQLPTVHPVAYSRHTEPTAQNKILHTVRPVLQHCESQVDTAGSNYTKHTRRQAHRGVAARNISRLPHGQMWNHVTSANCKSQNPSINSVGCIAYHITLA